MGKSTEKKILIGDLATTKYQGATEFLARQWVKSEMVTDPTTFLELLTKNHFDLCVVNLLLGGLGPFELIKLIRQKSFNADIKVIVVSRQVQRINIQNSIQAGAHDFIAEPFDNESFAQRILYHTAPKQEFDFTDLDKAVLDSRATPYLDLMVRSTELLSRTKRNQDSAAFFDVVQGVGKLLSSNRTSLILVDAEANTGIVLASSDDPKFHDFPISLVKYPEILHVVNTEHFVLIDDIAQNAMTQQVGQQVKTILIGSLMVFPVRFQGDVVGVMTVRRAQVKEIPPHSVLRVLQAIANGLAAHSNVRHLLRKIYKDYTTPKTA